jgi:hypothetical protein
VGKMKRYALGACLFTFVFVIVGGGLHLNPGGAFLAALSGTPLMIHIFNRWLEWHAGARVLRARNAARAPGRESAGGKGSHRLGRTADEPDSMVSPIEEPASR